MSQLEKVFEAIGPTGIVCKDLFAALELPRHDIEQYLTVLLSSKRVTVLNGMYVQVPKYDDYYDSRGRLKKGYEGISDLHRERADGTVVEAIQEPPPPKPPKPPKPVDMGPEQRTCVTCKLPFHRSFFTFRIIKRTGSVAWNFDCNRCKMRRDMARTEFGRWLLTQPESQWVRLRNQRKHDLKYKRDTLGIGIPPHHHKYDPVAKLQFEEQKVMQEKRFAEIFKTETATAPADLLAALQPVPVGFGGNTLIDALDRPSETAQDSPGEANDL